MIVAEPTPDIRILIGADPYVDETVVSDNLRIAFQPPLDEKQQSIVNNASQSLQDPHEHDGSTEYEFLNFLGHSLQHMRIIAESASVALEAAGYTTTIAELPLKGHKTSENLFELFAREQANQHALEQTA